MIRSRLLRGTVLATIALFLGLGLLWTVRNLGDVPSYGDTTEYLFRARTLKVDRYRGIAYPALLAGADRSWPGESFLGVRPQQSCEPPAPCEALRGVIPIQLLQWAVGLLALAYALRTLTRRSLPPLAFALLLGLLWLDPLVSHFHVSIMTDGLALAASLCFCAAWVEWVRERPRPALALAILVASELLMTALRSEKSAVAVTTAVASAGVGLIVARRASGRWLDTSSRRALAAAGVVVLVAVSAGIVNRHYVQVDLGRWPVRIWVLHMRVVFPNLESIHASLSPDARRRIPPNAAVVYDTSIVRARHVMAALTRDDPESLVWLTEELAQAALRAHGPGIAFDVVTDASENVLATFSFYGRLGRWGLRGEDPEDRRSDDVAETWHNFALYHPALSRWYLGTAAGLLVLALAAAAPAGVRALRGGGPGRETILTVTPFAAFAVANAFAFALVSDFVSVRYALFAHVMLLLVIYLGAWSAWRRMRGPGATRG